MWIAPIARMSNRVSTWAFLGAMWLSSIAIGGSTPAPALDPTGGSYNAAGTVPFNGHSHAHPDVRSSEDWYVRDVRRNGTLLVKNVDYTVVDDGSNKGVVVFASPLQRGDHVQVSGPTLEPGLHIGNIMFF
jgi:hypothetical protein